MRGAKNLSRDMLVKDLIRTAYRQLSVRYPRVIPERILECASKRVREAFDMEEGVRQQQLRFVCLCVRGE